MPFPTMESISWKFAGQPYDLNSILTPDQVWAKLDVPAEEVRQALITLTNSINAEKASSNIGFTANENVDVNANTIQLAFDALVNLLHGTEGATWLKSAGVTGLTGDNVQTLLESLKGYIDSLDTANDQALANHKLPTTNDHDGRYYTENEVDGFAVKKTGNQTIEGVKTFSSSPIVPTPTADMQASTKKYVDDNFTTKNDITTNRKLSATGDFKGTWNGAQMTQAEPGLSSAFNAHLAESTQKFSEVDADILALQTDKAAKTEVNALATNKADQADLEVERARIDALVAPPAGVDNAETADIRIGADGVTYASAGDAVRKQIIQLESDLEYTRKGIFNKRKLDITFTDGQGWNIYTNTFYNIMGGYSIIPVAELNGYLKVVSAYVNNACAAVNYFSGTPSAATYIGREGTIASDSITLIENVECSIPPNCTHVVLQGYYNTTDRPKPIFNANFHASNLIRFSLLNDVLTFSTYYNTKPIEFTFGKTGVNNLPDFKTIKNGIATLYNDVTDLFAPFVVGAVSNANGDHPDTQTFTGGRHNYNNGSGVDYTPTARNTKLKYYADNLPLNNGDSGVCSSLRIDWANMVQGYNTVKADGTGREILEEHHIMTYDGKEFECVTELQPLEAINMVTWYGMQAYLANYWTTVVFIGGTNRTPFNYSAHLESGNAAPNMMICTDTNNRLELEIDRSYDLGKGTFYSGTRGMFTSGEKGYCNFFANQQLTALAKYGLRGFYRFLPRISN